MARRPRLQPREIRLGALGARLADAKAVAADFAKEDLPPKRIRSFSEAAPDDLGAALSILGLIHDLGIVVHGPRGCAVAPSVAAGRIAVTDLDQRDTVLGSGDILVRTLKRLDEVMHPAALVVLGSPVVAINNDEIRAAVADAAAELGKPVVWGRTDGFRSSVAATGADAAAEALLALIDGVKADREPALVNLLTPWTGPTIDAIAESVAALGLRVNRLPAGAGVAEMRLAARAAASLVLDPDRLDALATGLETGFGVPRLTTPLPIGPEATAKALARLAAVAGREAPAIDVAPASIDALRGRRIAVSALPAFAFALAGLSEAAGAEVVALNLPHLDRTHVAALARFAERRPEAKIHVGEAQNFELANLLKRQAPDLLVGSAHAVATALRLGLPAARLDPADVLGALGAARLARAASDALAGAALAARLARQPARYSPGWFRRSPDWHIKLEVK